MAKILSSLIVCTLLTFACASVLKATNNNKKVVIAHRGASGYLPEQSNEAVVAAFMMAPDYIEMDVILTRDNVPIVTHDLYLDYVTNVAELYPGRNRSDSHFYVIDFTLAEIKRLKVTERLNGQATAQYPDRFPIWTSYFSISTFEERLQLIQGLTHIVYY